METRFIAEIGSNHNQSLDRALKLIGIAASFGFWAVKFQYYKADMLWHDGDRSIDAEPGEMPISFFPSLRAKCDELGIKLGCSVYHPSHVEKVAQYVDFLKISSFEVNNEELFLECYCTDKPVFLSHGIDSEWNIPLENVVNLHCVSRYPVSPDECFLALLPKYDGWSDHSANMGVVLSAVLCYNTEYIELHIDSEDGLGNETKHGHCWTPTMLDPLFRIIDDAEASRCAIDQDTADGLRKDLQHLKWKEEFDAR